MRKVVTLAVAGSAATLLALGGIGAVALADDSPAPAQLPTSTPTAPDSAPASPNPTDPGVPPQPFDDDRHDDDWDDRHDDDWDDRHDDDWDDRHDDDWDDRHDD
ncbi:hypothetical protein CH263_04430 [Rhodococcus sp. 06-1059B-a]|nr:hypothetical protein [Rhodococcus sp. 06-1059B-a]OZD71953.1 hypothetical protein CH263_04430 [Rhodococcus sp. 06-1059B-a]